MSVRERHPNNISECNSEMKTIIYIVSADIALNRTIVDDPYPGKNPRNDRSVYCHRLLFAQLFRTKDHWCLSSFYTACFFVYVLLYPWQITVHTSFSCRENARKLCQSVGANNRSVNIDNPTMKTLRSRNTKSVVLWLLFTES